MKKIYKIICQFCETEIDTESKKRQYCNDICKRKARWKKNKIKSEKSKYEKEVDFVKNMLNFEGNKYRFENK